MKDGTSVPDRKRRETSRSPERGNLPAPIAPIIGRDDELANIGRALDDGARWLTLTGPGGIGKTRLMQHAAALVGPSFVAHGAGGAWWIDARDLDSVSALAARVRRTLGLGSRTGDPIAAVGRLLRRQARVLVALDNLEQLAEAAAPVLAGWLAGAPQAVFLVTSRRPLGITGERPIRLAPLAVPGPIDDPAQAPGSGVALLTRALRAHGVEPLGAADWVAVDEIVRRVEGVPLALELAAARARTVGLPRLAAQLRDPLATLVRAGDDSRHASMRATLEDSRALLPVEGAVWFDALGVISAEFALDEFAAVAGADGAAEVGLAQLAAHGLVTAGVDPDGERRFRVFEVVRQYAREVLVSEGRMPALRARHADWCVEVARVLAQQWRSAPAEARQTALRVGDDLARAVVSLVADGRRALAARVWLAVDPGWALDGQHRRRLEVAALVGALDADGLACEVALATGDAHRDLGELAQAEDAYRAAEAAGGASMTLRALALARLAQVREVEGGIEAARATIGQAVARLAGATTQDDAAVYWDRARVEAEVHARRAHLARRQGQLREASEAIGVAMTAFAARGDIEGMAAMAYEAGVVAMFADTPSEALARFDEAAQLARQAGAPTMHAAAEVGRGIIAQADGAFDEAIARFADAAHTFRDLGLLHREGSALYSLAAAYLERGELAQALRVHAQAHACITAVGAARYELLLAALAAVAHARLGDLTTARHQLAIAEAAERRAAEEPNLRTVLTRVRHHLGQADAAPEASLAGDDPRLFARLCRVAADVAPATGLVVWDDGQVALPGGTRLDLRKRAPLRRLLIALAVQRMAAPGEALDFDALVAAGWPEERILPEAAVNRLHVALSTLRKLGLRELLIGGGHGYQLAPQVPVRYLAEPGPS